MFDVATIQQTTPGQNAETTNLGPRIQNHSPVDHVTLNVNTPGITPETAPELPALSAPEVSSGDNVQTADGKDTSALLSAASDDENIATLIDENMTLRAQVEVLEKDLMAASAALDNVLTARTVITMMKRATASRQPFPMRKSSLRKPMTLPLRQQISRPLSTGPWPHLMIRLPSHSNLRSMLPYRHMKTPWNPKGLPEGSMQVQLASYTSMAKAQLGIATLEQEIPDEFADISFMIKSATLASGKDVYRIISVPIDMATAKTICSHFWSMQYGCIIKMADNT